MYKIFCPSIWYSSDDGFEFFGSFLKDKITSLDSVNVVQLLEVLDFDAGDMKFFAFADFIVKNFDEFTAVWKTSD